ncbi:MAG TPA: FG-GAP repeat protein [Candidatus Limnocylindrales bacterium]
MNVLYGSAQGPTASGDQLWTLDSKGVKGTSHGRRNGLDRRGDLFGGAIASGDFDRDGHADLAIGSENGRLPGKSRRVGIVTVLHGSRRGLTASGDQLWSQAALPGTPERGDGFGASLATGDFDGDGYADLAIGVIGDDIGQLGNEGSVEILYGSPKGLSSSRARVLTRSMTGAPDADVAFGAALAAGDLNGDGRDELAVGAPTCNWVAYSSCTIAPGDVSVFYASTNGLVPAGSQIWSQDSPGIEDDPEEDDSFGFSLAVGDFDGDGYGDLGIGVPSESVDPCSSPDPAYCDVGAVAVLYGGEGGLVAAGSQLWHVEIPGVPGEIDHDLFEQQVFGYAIAAGDFDGDGRDDLAFSDPWAIVDGELYAGMVIVLYGSDAGIGIDRAQSWTQDSPGVPDTADGLDLFGRALTSADFGRSRNDDLVIGVPNEDLAGERDGGMVNVVFGGDTGLDGAGAQGWSQLTPGIRDAPEKGDRFGAALTP